MAKRPEQSLDVVGQSLLSQQSTQRQKYEKAKKKDQKWMKLLGIGLAGQSLVTSQLKKRTEEIKETGRISKLQSTLQAANFNSLTPIYQSIDPYENYAAFEQAYNDDPSSFNSIKNHLSPYIKTYVKQINGKDLSEEAFQAQYNLLENSLVTSIAEKAFSTKDQFKRGITEIAGEVGIDKNNMWHYFTGMDVNTLDGIKAQKLNKAVKQYGTSIFSKGNMRGLGNALTFGFIKDEQGEPNLVKSFGEDWRPLSQDIRNSFDVMNINSTIVEQVKANAPALKDRVAEARSDKDLYTRITNEFNTLEARIDDGSYWWKGDESPDRYSNFKEDRIENLVSDLNTEANSHIKERSIHTIGALSNRLGDPRETQFKQQFIDAYVREFDMKIGSPDYTEFVNSLQDVKSRDQLAMNFVLSQVATDRYAHSLFGIEETVALGTEPFIYDFDKIDQLMQPSFVQTDKGRVKTTEVYKNADRIDKEILYRGYVKGIVGNYLKSDKTSAELVGAAKEFMKQIPPPSGQNPEDLLNKILENLQEDVEKEDTWFFGESPKTIGDYTKSLTAPFFA